MTAGVPRLTVKARGEIRQYLQVNRRNALVRVAARERTVQQTVVQNTLISEISTDSTHSERSVLSLCGLHVRHASSWHVRPLVVIVGKPIQLPR